MSGRLVLLRHGQSYSNVDRRLDTRPPGSELTPLGHEQARDFARSTPHRPGLVVHSVAIRAVQTAGEICGVLGVPSAEVPGIHEVQVGDLEDRDDDAAFEEFNGIYDRWHRGERRLRLPGGETADDVLDRYLPAVADLRMRYLDDDEWTGDLVVVSHGAAIRLVAAELAGVDGEFVLSHHLGNAEPVVLAPVTDGRWSCLQWGALTPPFAAGADGVPVAEAARFGADPMG